MQSLSNWQYCHLYISKYDCHDNLQKIRFLEGLFNYCCFTGRKGQKWWPKRSTVITKPVHCSFHPRNPKAAGNLKQKSESLFHMPICCYKLYMWSFWSGHVSHGLCIFTVKSGNLSNRSLLIRLHLSFLYVIFVLPIIYNKPLNAFGKDLPKCCNSSKSVNCHKVVMF